MKEEKYTISFKYNGNICTKTVMATSPVEAKRKIQADYPEKIKEWKGTRRG